MQTPPPVSSDKRRRVFFALWPETGQQQRWARLAQDLGAPCRQVRPEHIHLTLVFCGAVSPQQFDCLVQGAERISVPRFSLRFDRLGHWRRSQVLWLGCEPDTVPGSLLQLVHALQHLARECGVAVEDRAFAPHVTIARKLARKPATLPEFSPVVWQPDAFSLMQSETLPGGPLYHLQHSWPLR